MLLDSGAAAQSAPSEHNCGTVPATAKQVDLDWLEVPSPNSFATLAGSTLTLGIRSRAQTDLRVELELIADGGDAKKVAKRLKAMTLPARGRLQIPIDLGHLIELACWGSDAQGWPAGPGRCLPGIESDDGDLQSPVLSDERVEFERLAWLCKSPCASMSSATNFEYECWYNQRESRAFDYAACVDVFGCEDPQSGDHLLPGVCELGGRRCDPNTNECVAECDPLLNSPDGANPDCIVWGYPATYGCTDWTSPPRCVPALCAENPLGTGLDSSECSQFVLGNL